MTYIEKDFSSTFNQYAAGTKTDKRSRKYMYKKSLTFIKKRITLNKSEHKG